MIQIKIDVAQNKIDVAQNNRDVARHVSTVIILLPTLSLTFHLRL